MSALPILSRNNASEQAPCGPRVVGLSSMVGARRCHDASLCLDHQFDSKLEGDTLLGVIFKTEPSPQPTLLAFSSRGRC